MIDFQARIAQLTSRVVELGKTLATAKARRTALALPVLDGNKAALKEINEIDALLLATQREVLTLNDAITEIKRQAEVARVEAEAQARKASEQAAQQEAGVILDCDKRIDDLLAQLKDQFERRKRAAIALERLDIVSTHQTNRLLQRFAPTAAVMHAGLRSFLDLDIVPIKHVRPLSESDSWLRQPLAADTQSENVHETPQQRSNTHVIHAK